MHSSRGEAAAHFVPQQGRNLITDDAIENAPRLLRVDQVAIDIAGVLEGLVHGLRRNLIESDPAYGVVFGETSQLIFKMRRDGFAFAVRVRGQINNRRCFGQLLQPVHYFFFPGDND